MPAYNAGRYIKAAIQSIQQQSYRDWELIVVNDGSTDKTGSIVAGLAKNDSRIRLISQENQGIVGALNRAASEARGTLLARMDADDLCDQQRFAKQLSFLDKNPGVVALGGAVYFTDPSGRRIIRHRPSLNHQGIVSELHRGNGGALIHPSIMLRKDAFKTAGRYRKKYQWIEDLDLYLRLAQVGQLANLPELILEYRQHLSSVNKRIPDRSHLKRKLLAEFGIDLQESFVASESDACAWKRSWAYDAVRGGEFVTARLNAVSAVLKRPLDKRNWTCLKYVHTTAAKRHEEFNIVRRSVHALAEYSSIDRHIDHYKVNAALERLRSRSVPVLSAQAGNDYIRNSILSGKAAAFGKIGDRECSALAWHLGLKQFYKYSWSAPSFSESDLSTQGGVFPNTPEFFHIFCELFLQRTRSLDATGVWFNPGEYEILRRYCPKAIRMELTTLDPYFHETPWTHALHGKKVLVIHPFHESIPKQHKNLSAIWSSKPGLMPEFDLRLIKSPYGFAKTQYPDWIAMLSDMERQMEELYQSWPFDVALLGCGAAGIPLAAFAKSLGAIGIHTGGPTQLLFGIRGGRWDNRTNYTPFYNSHWCRPTTAETPGEATKVDNSGYW